jgi:hypothetical protein
MVEKRRGKGEKGRRISGKEEDGMSEEGAKWGGWLCNGTHPPPLPSPSFPAFSMNGRPPPRVVADDGTASETRRRHGIGWAKEENGRG